LSNPVSAGRRFTAWLIRFRGNGLDDPVWVPVLCLDGRIVEPLLAEIRSAGLAACRTRMRPGWSFQFDPTCWCLWLGFGRYWEGQERLAEVMPLLLGGSHSRGESA